MKRVLSIFLFVSLTIPIVGTYSWLQYQKKTIRKEIKRQLIAGIDREELVFLKFDKNEATIQLRWHHSREFEYKGQMYDLVYAEMAGDSIYYWCWWDHEETKLNRQLEELVAKAMGQNTENEQSHERLSSFFKSLYCSNGIQIKSLISVPREHLACQYSSHYKSISIPPLEPPPKKTV